jgi:hypothetical protein
MILLTTIFALGLLSQTTAPVISNWDCAFSVQPDGTQRLICTPPTKPVEETPTTFRDLVVVCETRPAGVRKVITIDATEAEITFLDVTSPVIAGSPWTVIINQNVLGPVTLDFATWSALAPEKQWGMIRVNPPTINVQYMVSGACMRELVKKLQLKTGEPL